MTACACVAAIAETVEQSALEVHAEGAVKGMLKLAGASKKLIASSASTAMVSLLEHTQFHLKILELFVAATSDKNAQVRQYAMQYVLYQLNHTVQNGGAAIVTRTGGIDVLDRCLRKSLSDANPAVREASRAVFDILMEQWPKRAEALLADLDPNTRKAVIKSSASAAATSKKSKVDGSKTATPSIAAAASREYLSPVKPSPKKPLVASSPLNNHGEIVQAAATNLPQKTTPIQQILYDLQEDSKMCAGLDALAQFSSLPKPEHSQIQQQLESIIANPSSPLSLEILLNTCHLESLSKQSLISIDSIVAAGMSVLTGEAPVPCPSFLFTPQLQQLIKNHIESSMGPAEAFGFLSLSLAQNSNPALLKPRSRGPSSSPKTKSLAPGDLSGASFTAKMLAQFVAKHKNVIGSYQQQQIRSVVVSITRLFSLKSTTKSCRSDLFEILGVLVELFKDIVVKVLETVDFDIADEIKSTLGISEEMEEEEDRACEMETIEPKNAAPVSYFGDQSNLVDMTFESGLVEQSLLVDDAQPHQYHQTEYDDYQKQTTPKPAKTLLQQSDPNSPISRGMVGLATEDPLIDFDASVITPSTVCNPVPPPEPVPVSNGKVSKIRGNANNEFIKWFSKFVDKEYTTSVLEMLYCMANLQGGVSARPCSADCAVEMCGAVLDAVCQKDEGIGKEVTEALFLILGELFCREEVCRYLSRRYENGDSLVESLVSARSDARFEVAGSADNALIAFMDNMDTRFCFEAISFYWTEDATADDYQPHPNAGLFDYLGKLVKNHVGQDIRTEEASWHVDRVLAIGIGKFKSFPFLAFRKWASSRVDIRRSAMMCLVELCNVWKEDIEGNGGFWSKIGRLLSPSQMHLLTSYVSA
ncbi:clasp N terminal-domain-containing protein [Obelidium mucronatum]|nr:clasp N terminal-domain-containing protein [Obelidium mucronatum]